MSAGHEPSISIHGDTKHAGRINQQGQGYQFNIDQAYFESRSPLNSPWLEQFESWPIISDVDPLELGVHRAPINNGNAVPPYIERDVDSEIQDKLSRACRRGGFLLLVGDSTAGKTRSAYESIVAVAPTRRIFRPFGQTDLRDSLATLASHRQECLVWFDDLEQYIGAHGLNSAVVTSLRRASIPMVATIRGEQYRRFRQSYTDDTHQDNHSVSDFQRIVDQSQVILMSRLWSDDEIARAQECVDLRVMEAIQHSKSFGIAEYLAAGPLLLEEWSIAWCAEANPRGASLIAAAADCARAGIDVPIPRDLLISLHGLYLEGAGGELLRPEGLDQAFAWATRRRSGVASPLISAGYNEGYRAFDYLVDSVMRKDPLQPIPDGAWSSIIEFAKSSRELLASVGSAARRHSAHEVEWTSWLTLTEMGDPRGPMRLGSICHHAGEFSSALEWYEKAAIMGEPDGWTFVGLVHEQRKDIPKAEEYFRRAAEAGNTHGMNHLAAVLRKQGHVKESETWYREGLTRSKANDLSLNLADLLTETGQLEEAEIIYRDAIASGQSDAFTGLGNLLARSGKREEARDSWKEGVKNGIANAAAQLAIDAQSDNRRDDAAAWWRQAISLGSEKAILSLAIMLDKSKRRQDDAAEELFKRAFELDVDGSAYSYGIFLIGRNRFDEAEKYARKAVENQDEKAAYLLASILEKRGESKDEVVQWWERAALDGDKRAAAKLGNYLYEEDRYADAQPWLTMAAEAGDDQATCELGSVFEHLGNRAEAENCYFASFELGHAHAACRHGYLLGSLGELDAAIERYKVAYKAGHRHAAKVLEGIYRSSGRGREAAEWMRRGREGYPNSRMRTKSSKGRKRRRRHR